MADPDETTGTNGPVDESSTDAAADADDGELTRTRKVRRSFVSEKYDMLVEALYSGIERTHVETGMTFKDGRKGTVTADIDILAAETVETAAPLKKAS